jgi:hypothetical protein
LCCSLRLSLSSSRASPRGGKGGLARSTLRMPMALRLHGDASGRGGPDTKVSIRTPRTGYRPEFSTLKGDKLMERRYDNVPIYSYFPRRSTAVFKTPSYDICLGFSNFLFQLYLGRSMRLSEGALDTKETPLIVCTTTNTKQFPITLLA